eukprot:gnl/TRDRNA2_/TRDRNA2_124122_c0_seq2.p1 gnl/TRDRNA2_/TRDRNA2_124122_c0~~gnl/TRDRNA2_/TRDRNA2_124122_c0_seq2.p1  ORF type:complete len:208 (-),score=16.77 gnl/TRDRNA2_/TRDRNA2_124122_c0_seq2:332-955(-)
MASVRSSGDTWHGSDRHSSGLARISGNRTEIREVHRRGNRFGALRKGEFVHVFSSSANAWVDGIVVKFVGKNYVQVHYKIGSQCHSKTLLLHSKHLESPSGFGKEVDPAVGWRQRDPSSSETDMEESDNYMANVRNWMQQRPGETCTAQGRPHDRGVHGHRAAYGSIDGYDDAHPLKQFTGGCRRRGGSAGFGSLCYSDSSISGWRF